MERLDVFDCSNVLIASYFTEGAYAYLFVLR